MNFTLHHDGPCMLCAGATDDNDFDYCRSCGYTVLPFRETSSRPEPPPSSINIAGLARALAIIAKYDPSGDYSFAHDQLYVGGPVSELAEKMTSEELTELEDHKFDCWSKYS